MKLRLIYTIVLLALAVGCGTVAMKQQPTAPPDLATNAFMLNPEYQVPLETLRDSNLPYVSEAAGVVLAAMLGFVGYRNRRLKKTASVLTKSVTYFNPNQEQKDEIADLQESEGVREEVRRILKNG